jgi:hypothetical protein
MAVNTDQMAFRLHCATLLVFAMLALVPLRTSAHAQAGDIDFSYAVPGEPATFELLRFPLAPTLTDDYPRVLRVSVSNINAAGQPANNVRIRSSGASRLASSQIQINVLPPCSAVVSAIPPNVVGTDLQIDWNIGNLAAGQSATCDLRFSTRPTTVDGFAQFIALVSVDGGPFGGRFNIQSFFVTRTPSHVVDLQVSVSPSTIVAIPGLIREFEVVVRNNGPDVVGRPSVPVWTRFYRHAFVDGLPTPDPFRIGSTGDPDCQVFVTDLGGGLVILRALDVIFPTLAVGEERRCTLEVGILPSFEGQRALSFSVLDSGEFAPGVPSYFPVDPVPANNVASLTMISNVQSVPSTNVLALLVLAFAMLLTTFPLRRLLGRP